jgi:hypothetical protein
VAALTCSPCTEPVPASAPDFKGVHPSLAHAAGKLVAARAILAGCLVTGSLRWATRGQLPFLTGSQELTKQFGASGGGCRLSIAALPAPKPNQLAPTPALVSGSVLPELLYRQSVATFGEEGTAELINLVGLYCLVSVTLNGFDVAVPQEF